MPTFAAFDWSTTPLGPRSSWSPALATIYDVMMSAHVAMCAAWGPERTFLYNAAYAPFLGPRHPAALGRPMPEVWPEVWHEIEPLIARAMAGERVQFTAKHLVMTRHGHAEDTYWDFSYSALRDGAEVAGFLNVTTEATHHVVSEQRREAAEAALRARNSSLEQAVSERTGERDLARAAETSALADAERLQLALAAGAILGTWTWDLPTDSFTVDDAFATTFGLDPALGRHGIPLADIVATVHPDDRDGLDEAIREALRRGGRYAHQYRVRHRDGRYLWIEANGHVESGPDGTPLRFPGTLLDVGERRALAEERDNALAELHRLNETLEQRIEERTAELARSEEQLRQSQKMEAIGQLTGGVAHDFNNLLTVIRSSVDLLKRPNLAEERRERYIEAISQTVDRAARLTGQLLAFARRQALKPEVFSAGDSVRGLAGMMRTLTGSRIQISSELPDDPCYVDADASQFDTALVNLAVNARDAMAGEGRITIRVAAVDAVPAIRLHPSIAGPYVAVSLADTGSGIAPGIIDRIFEPFFTTKEVGKGTGLGLSQVIGFAKQSGGDITVTSAPGEGTTFTVYLPRVAPPDRPEEAADTGTLIDGHGTGVLVVEDNADVGTFAVQSLNDLGYVTVLAEDGAAALAALATDAERFDVVFSDVVMPGMSGIELGQEIRRLYRDLPVVLTSGYSHVLAQNGSHGFELLHKPYSVEQLSKMLSKAALWRRRKRLLDR